MRLHEKIYPENILPVDILSDITNNKFDTGNHIIIRPNVVITNDTYPPPGIGVSLALQSMTSQRSVLTVTLLPGVKIGRAAVVVAGLVVTKDVPARICVSSGI